MIVAEQFLELITNKEPRLKPTISIVQYKFDENPNDRLLDELSVPIPDLSNLNNEGLDISSLFITANYPVDIDFTKDINYLVDLVELKIHFKSLIDPDIKKLYQVLKDYETDVSNHIENRIQIPNMEILLFPNDGFTDKRNGWLMNKLGIELLDDNTVIGMSLKMPFDIHLVNDERNLNDDNIPRTISLTFFNRNCNINYYNGLDINNIKNEYNKEVALEEA